MGNKAHTAVIEPTQAKGLLSSVSLETLAGHFQLARGTTARQGTELSKTSFCGHMASYMNGDSWPKLMLERLFQVADLSNSGTALSFDDYVALLFVMGPSGSTKQRMSLLFRIYDFEAGGYVSKKSLQKMLVINTGLDSVSTSSWKVGVTKYDPSKDIVVETREKLHKAELSSMADVMVESAMAFYDQDKDGKLNYEEFLNFAADSLEIATLLETMEKPTRLDSPWAGLTTDKSDSKGM